MAPPLRVRKEIDSLTPSELASFREAVIAVRDDQELFRELPAAGQEVWPTGPASLAFNRALMKTVESALQTANADVTLPWWDWTNARSRREGLPAAFSVPTIDGGAQNPLSFTGAGIGELVKGGSPRLIRPGDPGVLPDASVMGALLDEKDIDEFYRGTESVGQTVSSWASTQQEDIYDPFGWLLLASIDRLWSLWQERYPGVELPTDVLGTKLEPFPYVVADVLDIRELGYVYEEPEAEARRASLLSGYLSDTVGGEDALDIGNEVRTLCTLLAADRIDPPISVGLFGDWGSGKSFFMDRMCQQIELLTARAAEARKNGEETYYCTAVRQIRFNAWHYADADLWANLANHIFESLAAPSPCTEAARDDQALRKARGEQANLAKRLAETRVEAERLTAQAARQAAKSGLERMREEFEAKGVVEVLAGEGAVAKEARDDLDWLAGNFTDQLPAQERSNVEQVTRLAEDLSGTAKQVKTATARAGLRWVAVGIIAAALVVLGYLLVQNRELSPALTWTAGALAWVASSYGVLKGPINTIREGAARAQRLNDRIEQQRQEETAELRRLQRSADERIAALQQEISALGSGERLYRLVRDRSTSSDYRGRLGIVASVCRDFEEMSRLLRQQRLARQPGAAHHASESSALTEGADESAPTPEGREAASTALPEIDRIILYIDDLDRCPPERVVEVLEAVHLMLALPLFVVVVGVDPRWLLQSLEKHYSGLLTSEGEGNPGDAESRWSSTAMNYLEKIFQIPFTLRPMDSKGYSRLIDHLTKDPPESQGAGERRGEAELTAATESPTRIQAEATGTDLPKPAAAEPIDVRPKSLTIDPVERGYLKLLAPMVETPRAAKRLTNTYRLIKASLGPDEIDTFVSSGEFRVALTLLGLLAGFPQTADVVFERILSAEDEADWWTTVGEAGHADEEHAELIAVLDRVRSDSALPQRAEQWKKWVRPVGQYSFQVGRLVVVEGPPSSAELAAQETQAGSTNGSAATRSRRAQAWEPPPPAEPGAKGTS